MAGPCILLKAGSEGLKCRGLISSDSLYVFQEIKCNVGLAALEPIYQAVECNVGLAALEPMGEDWPLLNIKVGLEMVLIPLQTNEKQSCHVAADSRPC
jgi:hypothetical protein